MTDPTEETARRIAELGNGALRRRLRPAFDHAAVAYASRVTIGGDELERMLEQAAQQADAAIWRRALASVAMDELDIGLGEALEHPAVIRAQELLGAPSLDRSVLLAAPEPAAQAEPDPRVEPQALAETEALRKSLLELMESPKSATLAEREPPELVDELDTRPEPQSEPHGPLEASTPDQSDDLAPQTIRLAAVHLEGIENLPRAGQYLELRFSEAGFDVVDAVGGDVIGRLRWDEIDALELPSGRWSLGRRRRRTRAQLVVRADRGEASFEIRGLTRSELREHLAPILAKVRGVSLIHSLGRRSAR